MRRLFLLVLLCCIAPCCGFTLFTPETLRDRERLCADIRRKYGEKQLTAFVRNMIQTHPEVDGVKLARSKVGTEWLTMDWNPFWHVISEEWAMRVGAEKSRDPGFQKFRMFWKCAEDRGVLVEGHREKSGALVLDSISVEEVVQLNWM